MQVSGDGIVRFVNATSGYKKDSTDMWYRLNLCDEGGEVLQVYGNKDVYAKVKDLEFGREVTPVFTLASGQRGMFVTLTDIILGG